MAGFNRRALLRGGLCAAGGAGLGLLATKVPEWVGPHRLPLSGGYAAADDQLAMIRDGEVTTTYRVPTTAPMVALTFDDGPQPEWTPMVLDQLDEVGAPATFFMIGEHLRANAHLVASRMDGHEIGNHTWTHPDLAEQNVHDVLAQLRQTHQEIVDVFGRPPVLMRPPYGHLGGSTLLAASVLSYQVVLWSAQMEPEAYATRTAAQVAAVVSAAKPGTIVLAHDVGDPARLPGLRGVADIVRGLRAKGLEPVTVSQLLATRVPAAARA
jgi:peptidoglycan/xylan/chitin deacetylase (PgdA/CDA1 family)